MDKLTYKSGGDDHNAINTLLSTRLYNILEIINGEKFRDCGLLSGAVKTICDYIGIVYEVYDGGRIRMSEANKKRFASVIAMLLIETKTPTF